MSITYTLPCTCLLLFDQELIPYYNSACCCSSWGNALQKSVRLCHFKSDLGEIWQDCSSRKHILIDRFGFLTDVTLSRRQPWCHFCLSNQPSSFALMLIKSDSRKWCYWCVCVCVCVCVCECHWILLLAVWNSIKWFIVFRKTFTVKCWRTTATQQGPEFEI